jgi:hypothetical protein
MAAVVAGQEDAHLVVTGLGELLPVHRATKAVIILATSPVGPLRKAAAVVVVPDLRVLRVAQAMVQQEERGLR